MAVDKNTLRQWFQRGVQHGATHMIVMCDQFDYDDYPVYVAVGEDAHEIVHKKESHSMQKVMEVYNLGLDMESQMNEFRAFNY